jgi:hypothetical protein
VIPYQLIGRIAGLLLFIKLILISCSKFTSGAGEDQDDSKKTEEELKAKEEEGKCFCARCLTFEMATVSCPVNLCSSLQIWSI